ncbi:lipoate--protein ligase family protein [Actinomadura gamaensis]|uniref:Biotin/lipoate A/B protein ligase family protein n=1 Tax=Actinomadura gamaensis TaxID=1763541 RepID=A0ABV9U4M7_9ACTN
MLSMIVDDVREPAWNLALDEALARVPGPRGGRRPAPRRRGRPGRPGSVPPQRPGVPSHGAAPYGVPPYGVSPYGVPSGRTAAERSVPVLRVWQNAPSVVIGRFQNVEEVVDLAACARDGVRVVRRASGGGAVYTDSGTLLFSLVRRPRPGERRISPDAPDLDVLVRTALGRLGYPPDVLASGGLGGKAGAGLSGKAGGGLGGNAGGIVQVAWLHARDAVLTHLAVHVTPINAYGPVYLMPPDGGTARGRNPPPSEVSGRHTLADLGAPITLDTVRAAVLSEIMDVYGIARTRRPDPEEQALRDHLYSVRYGDVTWNLSGPAGPRRAAREFTGG